MPSSGIGNIRVMAAGATILVTAIIASSYAIADEYPIGNKNTMWVEPYLIGLMRHLGEIYDSRKIARQSG